jgi:hypothetical protein
MENETHISFKHLLKSTWEHAGSLSTGIFLLVAQLLLFLFGAFIMPAREEFSTLNAMPMFQWLAETPLSASWWLIASIGVTGLLAANTLICSINSLAAKTQGRHWMLVLSPQIMHLGFLFLMVAHLASAVGGMRVTAPIREGEGVGLPEGRKMIIERVRVKEGLYGMLEDYSARAAFYSNNGERITQKTIAPNRPAFFEGIGFYIKDARRGLVLIEASREPGALWAMAGGTLFTFGTISLVWLKIRRGQ